MLSGEPYIPQNITVHLGPPSSYAQNVIVPFDDYIKNVASSEIYPTWQEEALEANIYAQISYALNRVYTEFYRSQGYNFDITNTTAMDQKFINGRNIFENIDKIVSEIFNSYIRRKGKIEPLAAKYCNGTTTTCNGLSQWGSEELAQQGYEAFDILKYYYGDDIELITGVPILEKVASYPGTPLRLNSEGKAVRSIQLALNRISQNYPLIPKIKNVDGIFGESTEQAVKEFQKIFNLTPDGIVGNATWYKIIALYTGITKLSELNSEGNKLFHVSLEYPDAISEGDSGEKVEILQYFLDLISDFYLTIPDVQMTGYFGAETKESVVAFQQQFNLPQTGVVGKETWDIMYNVFKGIVDTIFVKDEIFAIDTLPYGGQVLKYGSKGNDVKALQDYLTVISLIYMEIVPVRPTGVFGKETKEAVQEFQKLFGLKETGEVNRELWNLITSTYKDVVSADTSRPIQFPGETLKLGDIDEM
ncbi:MAG: peptidoglycan-binding protein [Aminipila sp.]